MESNNAIKVKERPILFSTPMVQAILAGRKTVTRRLNGWDERVNQNPNNWIPVGSEPVYPGDREEEDDINSYCDFQTHDTVWMALNKYPAQVDDILWVRETLYQNGELGLEYFANKEAIDESIIPNDYGPYGGDYSFRAIPNIHMPRWACRLRLKIKSIRVERLHDITEEDSIREGIEIKNDLRYFDRYDMTGYRDYGPLAKDGKPYWLGSAKDSFQSLWQSINGKESWDANPWVWRIEFKKL